MIYHEHIDDFTIYFNVSPAESRKHFELTASINPFNYRAGGVKLSLKVIPKRETSELINKSSVLDVFWGVEFCTQPKDKHLLDMQMAYRVLEGIGKAIEKKTRALLPHIGSSAAVVKAIEEKDYVSVCTLMELRCLRTANLDGKSHDEFLKKIVSHPSFRPFLIAFNAWDRASTITDPELQMCCAFAGYLIRSNFQRGVRITTRSTLDQDFGNLFELAGISPSDLERAPIKMPSSEKNTIATKSSSSDDNDLPWKK
ncbi:hypothetical protein [Aeromonas sp. MrichA-1]|uniref:hypothetical protein n=1 Tax=Aeromonas sp. MrichA-1 TaxID=2823362 RepID=UPI001B3269D5|nr:hypothetical protein [Aeromonas sp. MrichA-1]MBP4081953.1 hypothetical protein [Aeromonas sp. MrichA-1]